MVALHVTHWGHAGEKIILVHGGVQGSKRGGADHFPTQKALVDDGFHVLVPDRPGHGQSAFPGRPDDPEADGGSSPKCSERAPLVALKLSFSAGTRVQRFAKLIRIRFIRDSSRVAIST